MVILEHIVVKICGHSMGLYSRNFKHAGAWILLVLLSSLLFLNSCKTWDEDDMKTIREIFDESLVNGECYENLRVLCKDIGGRLSGSPQAEKAVTWAQDLLNKYRFDKVYLQEITVPHWVRGKKESARILVNNKTKFTPQICALGGSVSTSGPLEAGVVEVRNFKELETLGKKVIEGKLVFFNRPMDPRFIDTFQAYEGCVNQRYAGAKHAAKYGAIGVLVRSMSLKNDRVPHTGSMGYGDAKTKIPAVAISNWDSDHLSQLLKKSNNVKVSITTNCKTLPEKKSFNVIGEIKGSEYPGKIILVSGHLDSWDLGEGAHDDGAGVVQSIEVMRIFKSLGIKPRHTLRVVLFMNEENGNRGGKTYAKFVAKKNEIHVVAIESDSGAFTPRGFTIDGPKTKIKKLQRWKKLVKPYNLHVMEEGFGGVDINPLKKAVKNIVLIGFLPDSQRYFDYHHAVTDTFETVNKRELELGAASLATLVYLVDKYEI